MKAKNVIITVVCGGALGAGGYYLLNSKGGQTDKLITSAVDSINSVLTKQVDSIDAKLKSMMSPHYSGLDSLAIALKTVQWKPVKDGGDYEAESKKNFESKKKEVARQLQKAYEDNHITSEQMEELQKIIDQQQ